WDVLYTTTSGAVARQANQTRQRYVPLPEDPEFQKMIVAGERDPLIRRLHGVGMPEEQIAQITGASLQRVRGIRAQATSTEEMGAGWTAHDGSFLEEPGSTHTNINGPAGRQSRGLNGARGRPRFASSNESEGIGGAEVRDAPRSST